MKYNYLENLKNDIEQYLEDNDWKIDTDITREELEEELQDDLWTCDSVTGNGSGSYTFSSTEAEENLKGNYDLLKEAYNEFGIDTFDIEDMDNFEKHDVTIRCYLLNEAITEVLDELYE